MEFYRVAINGFGRIGRLLFRNLLSSPSVNVVAVNDIVDASVLAHLLKYDSSQGVLKDWEVKSDAENIYLTHIDSGKQKTVKVFNFLKEKSYHWGELEVDCVVECSGRLLTKDAVQCHLDAGAEKVLISAPAKDDAIKTIVFNVNHNSISTSDTVISGASCTTNALAPVVKVLHRKFGVQSGFMTTIHAFTSDQRLQDAPHADLRRTRAAANSIIPTTTGAAAAIGKVIPDLKGKLDGIAHRVPVLTGSLVDLVVRLGKNVTAEEVNAALESAQNETMLYLKDPIVSSDIVGSTYGSIFDSLLTKVLPTGEVKLYAWYDNESSYVSQLSRTLHYYISL
ncbi:type I glyceraldehyde-3-phosphate dehydrogenase [Candidatus Mycoplasma haematominutum]|uniref:Glyceraldehyde-3-phosphate dehydrogenase n=1 Tax=Candidatus Mycoplasma haematominutum 'Birmingham 1' TaxID=1116213 RepID=G8C3Y0_9MOLU|nr:type I glyceraldehyde-3-phosphate dehydrogenase [Candidatus Mycoplasma haematominutum]CCE67028.1 NAD-dependent glyceraldehyde-3-phosphate dehydrogenase [Candidatus Mycoplasma haematominutum 'Birmingham 1']